MNLSKIENYFIPDRILDIGANVGQFHILCQNYFPNSYIFSIEASEECEQYLKQITNQYSICLLSKDDSEYNFYSIKNNPINTGNSIYKELTHHYSEDQLNIIKKKGVKLDDLFTLDTGFDLIKIDTQGSELDIIVGGEILCSKAKGILLEVSLNEYNENSPLYSEVIAYMEKIGFKSKEILDEQYNHGSHQQDILFINEKFNNRSN